jgi:hypothetical protein
MGYMPTAPADANPLDPATPVGQLRLLISDSQLRTDPGDPSLPAEYYFSDVFLEGFLALNGGVLKLAAADAILALATNESMVSKKIRKENLQTDGPAVTNALRLLAQDYRAQGKLDRDELDAANGMYVAIVDYQRPLNPWDLYERAGAPLWH